MTETPKTLESAAGTSSNGGWKPYPAYKDSGVDWLGEVPEGWELCPAFGAFQPVCERNHGMQEKTVLSLSYGRIVVKPPEKLFGLVPESFETYQIANPGDIILRTTDLQNDHTSQRVGQVRQRGIITSAYLNLRVNEGMSPEYGHQFLNVWDLTKAIYGFGSGLRQNLDFVHFKRMPVLLPPPAEQFAIVRFLDHYDRLIGQYIRTKQKLVILLTEQKQAVIQRAVTRGIPSTGSGQDNSDVKLKPSGGDRLGDIPEHWEVKRLGSLGYFDKGRGISRSDITQDGLPAITYGDIYTQYGIETNMLCKYTTPSVASGAKEILKGDLLFTASGETIEDIGKTTLYSGNAPGYAGGDIIVLRPMEGDGLFLSYALNSPLCVLQKSAYGRGDIIVHISASKLKQITIPVPPEEEQHAIAEFLHNALADGERVSIQARREIALMREYRTRLIADVVTGKIDVREVAAGLPDLPPETEPDPTDVSELSEDQEREALDAAE